MIDFLLSPGRIKALLAGGGVLLFLFLALLVYAVSLSGRLDTARADHATTQEKLAAAVREGYRWQVAAGMTEGKVTALQGAVQDCQEREAAARADADARAAILRQARPRELPPGDRQRIIDDATRQTAIRRLNRPL